MNINLLTEFEQKFRANQDSIHRANFLLSKMDYFLANPKMSYWQENVDAVRKEYKEYSEYYSKPKSLIIESKDLVEIGKFGLED